MPSAHHSLLPGEDATSAFPRFYLEPELQGFESEKAGRPVYKDVEYVEIHIPGDSKSTWGGRVKDEHRMRWPAQYEAFKKGQEPVHDGYPLKEWPPMTPAMVANLASLNVHTVEQLAAVQDGALMNLGTGGRQIRDKARAWLEQAKGGEPLAALQAKVAELEARLQVAEANKADLAARLAERAVEKEAAQ